MIRPATAPRFLPLCFVFLFQIIQVSFAQWYDPNKIAKKPVETYLQAYEAAANGDYNKSLSLLEEALKLEPRYVEAYLSRAGIQADLRNYKASVVDFEKGFALDSVFSATYLLPYSISSAGTGDFEKALVLVRKFLQTPGLNEQSMRAGTYRKNSFEFAVAYAQSHNVADYRFAPKNLGDGINSAALEYYPSLTIDGGRMIFTRRLSEDEDFYESIFQDGNWTKAKALSGKINTNLNEGAQNISQDAEWLIFAGCNYPEGQGKCDLYIAYRTKNGGWTEPENMGNLINTEAWESSPSLSPDKKDLYFSSDRYGGYGGRDIWVSHRLPTGKWGKPVNAGSVINTSADEACAYIHADNTTLYFNSNGHPGYGLTDLFLSRKLNDSTWQTPENLGYPVNTIDDEGSLIVSADGKTSYYASDANTTRGGLDLFSFELREDLRAARTLWVRGRVFDKKTAAGLPSSVELTDMDSRRVVSRLQTDEEGNYLITLPVGKTYGFNVNRKGYLFYSDNFSLIGNTTDSFFTANIPLQPLEPGALIVLRNIFFDVNKSELKIESLPELDKVGQLMNENPKLKIEIGGHTDIDGTAAENLKLSQARARAVTKYLGSKGIQPQRMLSKGYGSSAPVGSNETQAGKRLNRRTELRIIAN